MRKIDLTAICDGFRQHVLSLKTFYTDSRTAIAPHPQNASHETTLAEIVFHRGYVLLEAFISEYFVGCVNINSVHFINSRRSAIQQSILTKHSQWDVSHLQYSPPSNIPANQVRALLDARNMNITFPDYAAMEQKARQWLSPVYAAKVAGVTQDRKQIIDVAKRVRNCIAHNSALSFSEMNHMITNLPQTGSIALLRRDNAVNSVGAYLKAAQPGIASRVEFFFEEFDAFAVQIR